MASVAEPPPAARRVFGDRLETARRYVERLVTSGIDRGLVGPREAPRIWERHVLNCAVVNAAIPQSVRVVDLGSGAGLPGIALAIARPDIHVELVEPMLRRSSWLDEAVEELQLGNVAVHRARAEDVAGRWTVDVVTARAVAPLARLLDWSRRLLRPGGQLLAIKGSSAARELAAVRGELLDAGIHDAAIEHFGDGLLDPVTTAVRIVVPERPPRGHDDRRAGRRPTRAQRVGYVDDATVSRET